MSSEDVIREIKNRWRGVRPFERHSLVLLVAGAVYIAIGWSYLRAEPTETRVQALEYALNWVDYNHWGYVWMLVGIMSIISARWPPVSETWGYIVLTGQTAAWSLFYLAGVVFGDSPTSNLSGALSWGLIAFMWWAISGLMNPQLVRKLMSRIQDLQAENLALHAELRKHRDRKE